MLAETRGARRFRWRALAPIALALLVCAGTLWQYGPTLGYGFVYDDYHFARPHDHVELDAVWRGPWDIHAIERPFYRPLTITFFAARFHLLRFDAQAYHALSLALFAIAGLLGAWFVAHVTRSFAAACWFAAFWTVHPNLPVSLVAWLTNQMHLLQTIVCLGAFGVWWTVKARGAIWWTPLLLLQIAAFLIKEDGVLLLPAILALHLLYRALADRTLRAPPIAIVIASLLLLAALMGVRQIALGDLGGYDLPPTRAQLWRNLTRGIGRAVLLRPARTLGAQWQAAFVMLVLPLGAWAAWRLRRAAPRAAASANAVANGSSTEAAPAGALAFLIACGLLTSVLFNLPFVLVSKPEQFYLVATGAILALAGAVTALLRVARPWLRPIVLIVTAITLGAMHHTSRELAALYGPAGAETRRTDTIAAGWAVVPPEVRAWLPVKFIPPNSGDLARDLSCVTFGLFPPEKDFEHRPFRWTMGHARIFARASASAVTFGLKPLLQEQPRRPFVVRVLVEGRLATEQALATEQEGGFAVRLPPPDPDSARMRLVEIVVDHTWTPGRGDARRLGVKLYDLSCKDPR